MIRHRQSANRSDTGGREILTGELMNKYDRLTDEQLIAKLRDGDRRIMDYIMDKYKSMVRKKSARNVSAGRGDGRSDSGGNDRAVQGGAGL